MKKRIYLIILTVLAVVSATASAQTIAVGTTKGGFTNQAGQSLSKVVSQKTNLQMRAQAFGGSSVYVPRANAGKLEFALVNELEAFYAVTGTVVYDGRKHPDLRVVSATIPFRVAFFVHKDSPINSIKDLKGKRVPSGWSSQGIIKQLVKGQLANGGLTYDDVVQVPTPSVVKGANDFAAGKTDVFFFVFGAGKVREVNAKVGGLKVLNFDPSPSAVAAAREFVPPAFAKPEKASKRNVGVTEPIHVMTYWHTISAGKTVSDDVVYTVVKAMHDNRSDLVKAFPGWGGFKSDKMAIDFKGLTYHPGAIKFFKEIGAWPPM